MSFHFVNRFTSRSPVPFSGYEPFRPDSNPSRFALPLCAFNHAGNSRADSSPFTRNPVYLGRAVYENPPKSRREHFDFPPRRTSGWNLDAFLPALPLPDGFRREMRRLCNACAQSKRRRKSPKNSALREIKCARRPPEDFSKFKKNHLTQQIKYTFLVDIMKKDAPYAEFTERFASTSFRICRMRMRAAADCAFRGYFLFVSVAAEI